MGAPGGKESYGLLLIPVAWPPICPRVGTVSVSAECKLFFNRCTEIIPSSQCPERGSLSLGSLAPRLASCEGGWECSLFLKTLAGPTSAAPHRRWAIKGMKTLHSERKSLQEVTLHVKGHKTSKCQIGSSGLRFNPF